MPAAIDLTEPEVERYARHILLPDVGGTGQMRLKRAHVLVIGAGGLGSPSLMYLAAAGVGQLTLIDPDLVDRSNLQRQILFSTADIGRGKAAAAAQRLAALNPEITITPIDARLDAANADGLIKTADLVLDGSDNFATRFLVADACQRQHRTLVSAAVFRHAAQITTVKPHAAPHLPCYRCLHPAPPHDDPAASCAEIGLLGSTTGVAGTLQATAALHELLGIGTGLAGKLLLWEALTMRFRLISVPRDLNCPHCHAR
ncbi:MAG: HesA/MoeB/ThiF family protein [Acidocella sp.]|nr:HesA/MoeB/ThiF family protein [Acidocella sp.]